MIVSPQIGAQGYNNLYRMLTAALVLITLAGCVSFLAPVNTRLYAPSVVCRERLSRCPFGLPADSLYIRNRLPYSCPDLNTRWVAFDSNKDIGPFRFAPPLYWRRRKALRQCATLRGLSVLEPFCCLAGGRVSCFGNSVSLV